MYTYVRGTFGTFASPVYASATRCEAFSNHRTWVGAVLAEHPACDCARRTMNNMYSILFYQQNAQHQHFKSLTLEALVDCRLTAFRCSDFSVLQLWFVRSFALLLILSKSSDHEAVRSGDCLRPRTLRRGSVMWLYTQERDGERRRDVIIAVNTAAATRHLV